jgi:hypothetical protein
MDDLILPVILVYSDLSLLKLCSMISNATLHINCIDSSIISSESLIVRHRNEHKLHRLGYEVGVGRYYLFIV